MSLSSESIKEDSRQPPKLSNLMEDVFRSLQKKLILVYDKDKLKDLRQFKAWIEEQLKQLTIGPLEFKTNPYW